MSLLLASLAWKPDLKPSAKLVLLFLAGRAGDDGCCSPTIEVITKAVGVSSATIYTALDTLEKAGLIERQLRRADSNVYRLHLTEVPRV
ncbi:helix-turn-helix domain-containing protein [Paraburkholderia sp. SIMBA_030]|uniref:helix-turn-helix domain-containing protein n=1 Tax=Paraburkholderia sp. SIMBA_030 TaxID=3085773 RepID=UPI003978FF5A